MPQSSVPVVRRLYQITHTVLVTVKVDSNAKRSCRLALCSINRNLDRYLVGFELANFFPMPEFWYLSWVTTIRVMALTNKGRAWQFILSSGTVVSASYFVLGPWRYKYILPAFWDVIQCAWSARIKRVLALALGRSRSTSSWTLQYIPYFDCRTCSPN